MSQILLFTNNPLNERLIEKRLRQLGHEVFTTKQMIQRCLSTESNKEFIQLFHHIILSETLANREVKQLLEVLKSYPLPILRKSDEYLEEADLEQWQTLGVTEWLETHPSLEALREKLCCEKTVNSGEVIPLPRAENRCALSSLNLSMGELNLFILLYRQQGQPISREEICLHLWNRKKNKSSMSQISVLVRYLRNKLAAQKIDGPIIETCWGKGYRMHETVYDQIYLDGSENLIMKQQKREFE